MLSHGQPLDIVNGQKIDPDKSLAWSNDKEYHHFFPQAYLARNGKGPTHSNVVANIVLLTSASNIAIRDKAPSDYLQTIIDSSGRDVLVQRLLTNLVPEDALDAALEDDYDTFLDRRSAFLHAEALRLTGTPAATGGVTADRGTDDVGTEPTPAPEADDTDVDPSE
jgi:hypothetical protein